MKSLPAPVDADPLTRAVIGAAMRVHSNLGPGLLEGVYETCLAYELDKSGMQVRRQVPLAVVYDGNKLDAGYRLDLLVNEQLLVEVKSVDRLAPIHLAQVLTYLRLSSLRIGLLLNFNVEHLRNGIRRIAN